MRVVLDTNVFISGVFFSGPPHEILKAWRDKRIKIVISEEILEEYRRVGTELSRKYPEVNLEPFLTLLAVEAEIFKTPALPEQVCKDADDDKFLACALSGRCKLIITGDKILQKTSGYKGIQVVTPGKFVRETLEK